MTACAPAWIVDHAGQTTPAGVYRFDFGNCMNAKLSYEAHIKQEAQGRPADAGQTWPGYWTLIFDSLDERVKGGAYKWENADRYMRYIIDERRAAGLPDLPAYITAVLPVVPQGTGPERLVCPGEERALKLRS